MERNLLKGQAKISQLEHHRQNLKKEIDLEKSKSLKGQDVLQKFLTEKPAGSIEIGKQSITIQVQHFSPNDVEILTSIALENQFVLNVK
jgi:hypothetical protein